MEKTNFLLCELLSIENSFWVRDWDLFISLLIEWVHLYLMCIYILIIVYSIGFPYDPSSGPY